MGALCCLYHTYAPYAPDGLTAQINHVGISCVQCVYASDLILRNFHSKVHYVSAIGVDLVSTSSGYCSRNITLLV